GLEGSDWAGQPGYRIELIDHEKLDPPLPRDAFLETEPFGTELRELAESGAKGLFYNSRRGLNQGAYLTEATPTLLAILNRAYVAFAGKGLPFVPPDGAATTEAAPPSYTLDDALETLFIERPMAEDLMLLWRAKKNIILQGPPGVGKSFAAQKLAFALIEAEDRARLGFVQFHQSYSYEDFVEGFRPTASGFELKPGKFVEFCRRAEADPNRNYVFVIDEINRGNLSKILGELMLLIESDKRDTRWAMPLASGKVPFHVPSNVYIMGLMNTADRSLAVVDYALRRRFAFIDMVPNLDAPKFREQMEGAGLGKSLVDTIVQRVGALNREIIDDVANLGPGFAIGHSFFCAAPAKGEDDYAWYTRVIQTEIVPLLREYWFDAPTKADRWRDQLLAPL
ncbi:MAG: AAA family ATPase, partial [Polynucleobacter sp.]|nr:AAA family ATPase [Polynucleobacter sp.]